MKFLSYSINSGSQKNTVNGSAIATSVVSVYARDLYILRNWSVQVCGEQVASLKSTRQAGRLETEAGFLYCRTENSFLSSKLQILFLKPYTDWMSPCTLSLVISLKSIDCKHSSYIQNTAPSRLLFDQTTVHRSLDKLTHKINHHGFLKWSYSLIFRKMGLMMETMFF